MSARMMCVKSEQGAGFRAPRKMDARPTGCGNVSSFQPSVGANVRDSSKPSHWQVANTPRPTADQERYVRFEQADRRPQDFWTASITSFFDSILQEGHHDEHRGQRNGASRRSSSLPPQAQEAEHQIEYPVQSPRFVAPEVRKSYAHEIQPIQARHGYPQSIEVLKPIEVQKKSQSNKEHTAGEVTKALAPPASMHSTLGSTLHGEMRASDQDFTELAQDLAPAPRLSLAPAPIFKVAQATAPMDSEDVPQDVPMTARTRRLHDERISSIRKITSTVLGHGDSIHSELRGLEQDVTQLTREMEALKSQLARRDGDASAPRASPRTSQALV